MKPAAGAIRRYGPSARRSLSIETAARAGQLRVMPLIVRVRHP